MTTPPPDPALTREELDSIDRWGGNQEPSPARDRLEKLIAFARAADEALREIEEEATEHMGGKPASRLKIIAGYARAARLREKEGE